MRYGAVTQKLTISCPRDKRGFIYPKVYCCVGKNPRLDPTWVTWIHSVPAMPLQALGASKPAQQPPASEGLSSMHSVELPFLQMPEPTRVKAHNIQLVSCPVSLTNHTATIRRSVDTRFAPTTAQVGLGLTVTQCATRRTLYTRHISLV